MLTPENLHMLRHHPDPEIADTEAQQTILYLLDHIAGLERRDDIVSRERADAQIRVAELEAELESAKAERDEWRDKERITSELFEAACNDLGDAQEKLATYEQAARESEMPPAEVLAGMEKEFPNIPEHHPRPGVGRCGFCEHYERNQFHFGAGTCRLDGDGRSYDLDYCDQFNGNPCDCHACAEKRGHGSQTYVLCPTCGNKRCPKASNHENACTGSNEPGQPGSIYA